MTTTSQLEDTYPGIRSRYNEKVFAVFDPDLRGPPSLISKQLIVQNYAPKVSVISTELSNGIAFKFGFTGFLDFLNHFEQSLIEQDVGVISAIPGSAPERLNFRFVGPIQDQLKEQEAMLQVRRASLGSSSGAGGNMSSSGILSSQKFSSTELYSLTTLDNYLNDYIKLVDAKMKNKGVNKEKFTKFGDCSSIDGDTMLDITLLQNSIYLKLLTKLISSNTISPFEFFNHPIMQLFIISSNDDIMKVRNIISEWKNQSLPTWLDLDSIMEMVIIIINKNSPDELQRGLKIQEDLKISMGISSVITPIYIPNDDSSAVETIRLFPPIYAQVDDEINRITNINKVVTIPKNTFEVIFVQLQEIIYKGMIPYMERKIRIWTEEVVSPRKSFTGRLFNASKKWGGSSSSSSTQKKSSFFSFGASSTGKDEGEQVSSSSTASFNPTEGYYNAMSQEMIIRRLGDWSFMLRDYKSSYTTYEILKKDFLNDKAYSYLSSLQEFMIISLLVGASNKIDPLDRNLMHGSSSGGITTKIITDVITPLVDSAYYSYLSRCNLKTYTIRLTLIIAELFFVLGQSSAMMPNSSASTVQANTYFNESLKLFKKLIDSRLLGTSPNAKLMERVAYVYFNYDKPLSKSVKLQQRESYYEAHNPNKLSESKMICLGQSRNRKAIMWLLLAARELDPVLKPVQVRLLVWCIENGFREEEKTEADLVWLYRDQGLLSKLRKSLDG